MSTIPSNLARTSTAMTSDAMMSHLRRTHADLARVQTELGTGKRVNAPSDAPESIGLIRSMQTVRAQFEQDRKALGTAGDAAAMTDQSLGEVSQLVMQAKNIASSQIGIGSDADTRASEAAVIDSLVDTLVQLGNTQHRDAYLFGGKRASEQPFVERLGGIEYVGSDQALTQHVNGSDYALNTTGAALGALSSRIEGTANLNVQATEQTRVRDIEGARGAGVSLGSVRVTVDGETTDVDLRGVERLSDVASRVNTALDGAGSLDVTGNGFTLTASTDEQIDIADIGAATTAADLGIAITAEDGQANPGPDINPRLTESTRLTDLGAAIDFDSGLKITNGSKTTVVDFTNAETVEDMINQVARADVGVRLQINASATGFDLVNAVSGTHLSVGENAGGETATTLGLRSLGGDTRLADLNHGNGVRRQQGEADLQIDMGDGATRFEADLDGAATVQDAIDTILAAADDAGLDPGDLEIGMAADGNGLVFTSNLAGGDTFRVASINGSRAAEDLGIARSTSGDSFTGDDVGKVRTESALTHLMMLRDALLNNDDQQITEAGERLGRDIADVAGVRAREGVRAERIEAELNRIEQRDIQTQSMLSDLQDVDHAEAVSRFTRLQQQLEATLLSGQQVMRLSLLDFLR